MKRRNFIKQSSFTVGSAILLEGMVNAQGDASETVELCPETIDGGMATNKKFTFLATTTKWNISGWYASNPGTVGGGGKWGDAEWVTGFVDGDNDESWKLSGIDYRSVPPFEKTKKERGCTYPGTAALDHQDHEEGYPKWTGQDGKTIEVPTGNGKEAAQPGAIEGKVWNVKEKESLSAKGTDHLQYFWKVTYTRPENPKCTK